MDYKEAYRRIKRDECAGMCCVPEGEPCVENCQWKSVLEALEKQILLKPVPHEDTGTIRYTDSYRCPRCGGGFNGTGIADYCYHCGQRLDWGDHDDR